MINIKQNNWRNVSIPQVEKIAASALSKLLEELFLVGNTGMVAVLPLQGREQRTC